MYSFLCSILGEVSGGGLIGNLLTQSSNVELSLWPETKYRVQVTCKNKVSDRKPFVRFIVIFGYANSITSSSIKFPPEQIQNIKIAIYTSET